MATVRGQVTRCAEPEREHFPAVETHLIDSSHVAQTFKVQIMQPARRRGDTTKLPVVYATDGNLTFDMFKGISYLLQLARRDALRFILVGIGYPGDCPLAGAVLRGRDLLCAANPKVDATPPPIEGVLTPAVGTKELYGAEDFKRFVARELIPLVDERYATVPGERTYFGHSAGGGFGLYTLFTQPDLFKNYVVSSPGLIFHGESSGGLHYDNYDFMFQQAHRFIASGTALRSTRLYMSVGAEEEFEPPPAAGYHFTSSFYRMVSLLKTAAIPGLELITQVFPGATHMAACPMAFLHGVPAVLKSISAARAVGVGMREGQP